MKTPAEAACQHLLFNQLAVILPGFAAAGNFIHYVVLKKRNSVYVIFLLISQIPIAPVINSLINQMPVKSD